MRRNNVQGVAVYLLAALGVIGQANGQDKPSAAAPQSPADVSRSGEARSVEGSGSVPYRTESVRGQVVWLNEALKEHFGVSTVPEVVHGSLAILTTDKQLLPLVEDLRGRSFRTDPRLRKMQVELFVRRYEKQPLLQIIRVYELKNGKRLEVDYWCDICAIVMFEMGPCACCQDDNRLRKRLADTNVEVPSDDK